MRTNENVVETTAIVPPDGGWGWIIVVSSFFCNFMIDGVLYTFGIFLNHISETFEVHPTKVALGNSIMVGCYAMSGPITCMIINKCGFQVVGIIGGVTAATAYFTSTLIPSIYAFIPILGVLGGIGFGMMYLPAIVVVGYYFERWRAMATSVAVTGSALGIMTFPLIMEELLKELHWKKKFYVIAAGLLITSILALTYLPLKPVRVLIKDNQIIEVLGKVPPQDASTSDGQKPKKKKKCCSCCRKYGRPEQGEIMISTSLLTLKSHTSAIDEHKVEKKMKFTNIIDITLLKSPSFLLLVMSGLISFLGLFVPFTYIAQRAEETGVSPEISHFLYTALGVSNAVGRLLSGLCSSFPQFTPLTVSYIHITICGLVTIGSYFVTDVYSHFIYICLFGITSACIAAIRAPIVADMLGLDRLASAYSLLMIFYGFAGFMGLPIAGAIITSQHSYNASFLYAGCVLTISAVMLMPISRINKWEKRRSQEH
jgi:MFS family permease